jgi:gliding motility-associated-like protein
MSKWVLFFVLFFSTGVISVAQKIWLHPNKGQWDDRIHYSVDLSNGKMYVDDKGFTFSLNDALSHDHDEEDQTVHAQVLKFQFEGSQWSGKKSEALQSSFYRNYFLGSDSAQWRSNVYSVGRTTLEDFYPGIDLELDGTKQKFKYSFIVQPGANASAIAMHISGSEKIVLRDGALVTYTDFGEIIDEAPMAWNIGTNGRKIPVKVSFALTGNTVNYVFPEGYDEQLPLVIDPYLVFSTFSGSTMDNWGMTATPDSDGNLYGGGIVFNMAGSYPTTTGAFDVTFNGGNNYTYVFGSSTYNMSGFDAAITKFNATGTQLLYSTYLGGAGNEAPHSLVTDENANLYIMGVTGSIDFPTVSGCFDVSFNGGPTVAENELGYNGADIFVTRINASGSALSGSTFVGGTGTDGINIGTLNYNYGDPFRGEIMVKDGFVYVSSTTQSTDFPTLGASQGSLNGAQDAVIFRLNAALTTLSWSTYFGGSGLESGNSIQLASNGNVFVAGGTTSSTLPFLSGEDLTYNGGISDGYVVKLQGGTSVIMAGTFMGLSEYDQAYFVQLDLDNNVYVYGQTSSSWPISPGVYGVPNSGQFIRKYNNALTSILWSTMVGAGTGNPEISPTAFLVSDCYEIYFSGWGGVINSSYSNQASFSSTTGFPTTLEAYQSSTNGSNFYIAVLEQNAASLKYATFMGGATSSYNHVDGGTSRFDKSGRIYHAVCGACGGSDYGFTSTPGVWSPTNQSPNCNLAAFKFELSTIEAIVATPQSLVCLPDPVIFDNNSSNGNSFLWDFGDGTTSNLVNPTHVYPGPGIYTVLLVVSDSNGCFTPDSVEFEVVIGDFQGGVIQPTQPVCPGMPYQMEAYGGSVYQWTPAVLLDDPTSPTPIATVTETTLFTVVISDSCGIDTVTAVLPVYPVNTSISNDTSVCIGNSAFLEASGGGTYVWSPAETLNNSLVYNPVATPDSTTTYSVIITTVDGCKSYDTVDVAVFYDPPIPILPDSVWMCRNGAVDVVADGGDTYLWSPNSAISSITSPVVTLSPADDQWYICDFFNACGSATDSVFVDVLDANVDAFGDTTICPGGIAVLSATGGITYSWSPVQGLNSPVGSSINASPSLNTAYTVTGTDSNGCTDTASVYIQLYPQPSVIVSSDVYAIQGDIIQINASGSSSGTFEWSPAEFLSCVNCPSPNTSVTQNTTFTVLFTDQNGCTASDSVSVYFDPIVYIPNTFTPNGDESNQGFQVVASNVIDLKLYIFNRWGELIFEMSDLSDYWDGSYKGFKCQDGTYTWKVTFFDLENKYYERTGHVNLLR